MRNHYEINGDLVWIRLERRAEPALHAMIDTADLPKLLTINCRWIAQAAMTSPTFYATAVIGNKGEPRTKMYLHRLIMNAEQGKEVDHVNGNGLDNRRANLRVVSRNVNQQNRTRPRRGSASGVPGITLTKGKWRVCFMRDGKLHRLGTFADKEQAIRVAEGFRAAYDNGGMPIAQAS